MQKKKLSLYSFMIGKEGCHFISNMTVMNHINTNLMTSLKLAQKVTQEVTTKNVPAHNKSLML